MLQIEDADWLEAEPCHSYDLPERHRHAPRSNSKATSPSHRALSILARVSTAHQVMLDVCRLTRCSIKGCKAYTRIINGRHAARITQ